MKTILTITTLLFGITTQAFAQFDFQLQPQREAQIEVSFQDLKENPPEKDVRNFVQHIETVVEHFEIEANIDIVFSERKDSPLAQIYKLPKLFGSKESYVIHVKPEALVTDTLSQHVAYHEICHIVVWRNLEKLPAGTAKFIDDEEIRVERQVYFFVGNKKYLEFLLKNGSIPDSGEKIDAKKYAEILQEIFEGSK